MKRIRARLTYANVISTLALFLVLAGGTAIAADQLGKNSVGAKQLKASSIGTGKLKAGAVKGGKLADGAVTATKLADGAVTATKLAPGAVSGKNLTITKRSASTTAPKEGLSEATVLVSCLPGETLIGGGAGWTFTGPDQLPFLLESAELPSKPGTWRAVGFNEAPVPLTLTAYAYCLAA